MLFGCRSTTNLNKRIELLESSVYKSLKADVKEKMIRQPYTGLVSLFNTCDDDDDDGDDDDVAQL